MSTLLRFSIKIMLTIIILVACTGEDNQVVPKEQKDRSVKVILVVIDGPRYSETWGRNPALYIPSQLELSKQGVLFSNFYNEGLTRTVPGHTAITTGSYESVINDGSESPSSPSIFQRYLRSRSAPRDKAWLIASKSKLLPLGSTKDLDWHMSYSPSLDIEERDDNETFQRALEILNTHTPDLTMIHFAGPDRRGHANDWFGYLDKIKEVDHYVGRIWNYLQDHADYANNTILLVTADHGRHLDGISTGFANHGDKCDGCRHIYLLALGPGLSGGVQIETPYNQTDIAPTIARIQNFTWEGEGNIIKELIPE